MSTTTLITIAVAVGGGIVFVAVVAAIVFTVDRTKHGSRADSAQKCKKLHVVYVALEVRCCAVHTVCFAAMPRGGGMFLVSCVWLRWTRDALPNAAGMEGERVGGSGWCDWDPARRTPPCLKPRLPPHKAAPPAQPCG